jgi:hypothetical protein
VLSKGNEIKKKSGAPGGTRTPDLLVRSQTLYPTELRAHCVRGNINIGEVCAASEVGKAERTRRRERERKQGKNRKRDSSCGSE